MVKVILNLGTSCLFTGVKHIVYSTSGKMKEQLERAVTILCRYQMDVTKWINLGGGNRSKVLVE